MTSGLARAGFDIDLRAGEAREDAFARVIGDALIEHKRDFRCSESGNLFIEYRQKGKPSGIATTTADYWAFEYEERHWLVVPTEELKRIARRIWQLFPERRVNGGDFNRYEGVLVPITCLVSAQRDWSRRD